MNKRIILIVALLLFFVEAVLVYWFRFGFETIALRETMYLLPPFFAVISGMVAVRTFGITGSRSMTLLLLTAGISYWFFGEILFNYYEYILHIDPYPSAADFFYILAYPLIFFGLWNEIRLAQVTWKNIAKPTLFLFSLVALLLAAIIGYFGIYQAYSPDETFLSNIVAISYGVGDLFLILATILLLVLMWEFRGGKLARVWLLLFIGFLFTLIADILFALYNVEYTMQDWFYKSLLDSFWMAGYLVFALALFEFSFSIQDAYKNVVLQAQNKGLPTSVPSAAPIEKESAGQAVATSDAPVQEEKKETV